MSLFLLYYVHVAFWIDRTRQLAYYLLQINFRHLQYDNQIEMTPGNITL